MSKENEMYRKQGAKPKVKQHLPVIGPNREKPRKFASPSSGDRHFQENESLPRRPQELISIDNMSLVTARQGNKLPYCRRTSSAPLSRWSPSRISRPAHLLTHKIVFSSTKYAIRFQWPSIQEQLNFKDNYTDASESSQNPMGKVSTKEKGVNVHIPHPPQHNRPGVSSEKSTNKELDERQEDEVKWRPRLKSDQWRPVSAFPKMLPTRTSFAAEQTKGEEVLKAKNLEHNSFSISYTCPLQDNTKSDEGQSASFTEPSSRQGRDQKMLSKQRENEREIKAATISVKRDGLLYKRN
ncbi:hypothetical protein OS493_026536 [Desmophyllum pertusum]|uniref:Uncharacterized protein n=1 Tax=Desmophyllum pertusum TaxID=174260 RepID=A0A9X0CJ79_9CNID|nr:hypothetical protein OS493_026536 [Desmophyllum pertusum]